jgi:hypothetical protein
VREVPLSLSPPAPKRANASRLTVGRERYSVLYWYRFPTGETTGRYRTKWKGIADALYYRKNGGAIIMVAAPFQGNQK